MRYYTHEQVHTHFTLFKTKLSSLCPGGLFQTVTRRQQRAIVAVYHTLFASILDNGNLHLGQICILRVLNVS